MSKCCFCGKEVEYKVNVNDPRPIRVKGEEMPICCNECNARIVVPTRVAVWGMEKDLKEKLAEKDSAEQSKYQNVLELTKMCTEKDKQIEQLKQQISEKDKIYVESLIKLEKESEEQLEKQATIYYRHLKEKDQEKIEFAVEQILDIKEKVFGTREMGIIFDIPPVQDAFDVIENKIKQLKEME